MTTSVDSQNQAIAQLLSSFDQNRAKFTPDANGRRLLFEHYALLCKHLCQLFKAMHFNIYAKSSPISPNLGGILTLRGVGRAIALQYIKIPADDLTIAGLSYNKAMSINIADMSQVDERYPKLNGKRMSEIDRRLRRITREVLATPVFNPADKKPVAVIEISNHITQKPFSAETEKNLARIAELFYQSLINGSLSLIFPAIRDTGKKSYQTQLTVEYPSEVFAEELSRSQLKPTSADNKALPPSSPVMNEEDKEDEEMSEEEFEEELEEIEEELEEIEGELAEEGKESGEKKSEPYEVLKALRVMEKPQKTEYPYESDGKVYQDPYAYLAEQGIVDKKELHHTVVSAESEEKPVEPVLILTHKVSLTDIGISLSRYHRLPYSPYDPTIAKDEKLIGKLKPEFLQRQKFIPLEQTSRWIKVITTHPRELEQEGLLRQIFGGTPCKVYITTDLEFQFTFELFFGEDPANNVNAMLDTLSKQYGAGVSDDFDPEKAEKGVVDNELVMLVNKIITDAYNRKVSDIHIEPYPGKAKTRIRFRVDGSMMEYLSLPSTVKEAIITRIKVMANLDISDRRRPQDGKIAMKKFSPLNIELRVATIPTAGGVEDAVLRILASGEPLPLEKLGILPQNEQRLIPLIEKPYGILFVCGPTGSGKTTTLHSILKHLNTPETKIWTAEDPVEITQTGLRQVQVNRKAGMDFATTMRAFLRADPDIIMVGEMRDHETVSTGVEASLTGHLVFSTLHTNSAPEAIVRLLDMGMDPFNFADALLGILAQRLAKRLCDNCKESYIASDEEMRLLVQEYSIELLKTPQWIKDSEGEMKKLMNEWINAYAKNGKFTLKRAVGCSICNAGYKGRVGLHELMVGSDRIKRLIQQKATVETLVAACLEEGMLTLKMDGIHKVLMGITDIKQVRSVCVK